jgi:hypothetical protein
MKRVFRNGRYANVTATVALIAALGGTSYAAAVTLAPNSVGRAQLQNNSVTSKKVRNRSLLAKDFKRGQLPRGARGAQGPAGPAGPTGATGPAGPFPDLLQSGKTLRGTYAMQADVANGQIRTGISFGFTLASAPIPHFIRVGGAVPAECAGGRVAAPEASPGHLCVYEGVQVNLDANRGVVNPVNDDAPNRSTTTFGAAVYASCGASTPCVGEGTWAVTAP